MASVRYPTLSCSSPAILLPQHRSRGAAEVAKVAFSRGWGSEKGSARKARAVSVGLRRYKGTVMREEKLADMIEKKVAEAMETCGGGDGKAGDSDGCRVAWDEVEEVSKAKADLRRRISGSAADPLEPYCRDHPDTDECVVFDGDE